MKIAFLIQVHQKPKQIEALISSLLRDEEHHCFVHVDRKSEALYVRLSQMYDHHRNVDILDERVVVNWSGFSQVEATLKLMNSVEESDGIFDRVQVMSGEDFPVKSLEYIASYLSENRDREFIDYEAIGVYRWRIRQYNFFTEYPGNRTLPIRAIQRALKEMQKCLPERKNFQNLQLYKGSSWFNLSRDAVAYILHFLDENPEYIEQFRYSACADEHFFQILLLNSKFKKRVVPDNLYYMEWPSGQNGPAYLDTESLKRAKGDKHILFARKVDERTALMLAKGER